MRFWDSSALVPLVIDQASSREAERWAREDPELVVWTLSQVEVTSALRRLARDGELREADADAAEALAEATLEQAHQVQDLERVKDCAYRLMRMHPLRAADAMQLGAALSWARGAPRGLVLHTLDRRLGLAARREGFEVIGA